ncbi:hypothetical protein CsSME_00027054 [Camellia sinensis var. sinensis]
MVHTLEAIRVGAIGTISALITHGLDAIKSTPQMLVSYEADLTHKLSQFPLIVVYQQEGYNQEECHLTK